MRQVAAWPMQWIIKQTSQDAGQDLQRVEVQCMQLKQTSVADMNMTRKYMYIILACI